jgi:hypothetical protein
LDVNPVESGDSNASNMQHMAVLWDSLVPVGPGDFTFSPVSVDFRTVDADTGPFSDGRVMMTVQNSVDLAGISMTGTHAGEFELVSPDLSSGPVTIPIDTALVFQWSPAGNDGLARQVKATLPTTGLPSEFEIELAGMTQTPGGGPGTGSIDIGGWMIEMDRNGSVTTLTIPGGTMLNNHDLLIVGRDATRQVFESH